MEFEVFSAPDAQKGSSREPIHSDVCMISDLSLMRAELVLCLSGELAEHFPYCGTKQGESDISKLNEMRISVMRRMLKLATVGQQKPTFRTPSLHCEDSEVEGVVQAENMETYGVLEFLEEGELQEGQTEDIVRMRRIARWIVRAYDEHIQNETSPGSCDVVQSSSASGSSFLQAAADWIIAFAW